MMTVTQKLLLILAYALVLLALWFLPAFGETHQVRQIFLPMAANGPVPQMISTAWVRPSPTATTMP